MSWELSTCWKLLSVLTASNLDKVGALLCRRNGTIIMVLNNATGPEQLEQNPGESGAGPDPPAALPVAQANR